MKDIYAVLSKLNIKYEKIEHDPVYTVEEADKIHDKIGGMQCKNLFLRNNKGKKHWLLVTEAHKKVNLKELGTKLENERLSLASPERLKKYLGLEPGSVSPFGLINSNPGEVAVIIDKEILESETISFHPNINTATLVIDTEDFKRFLEYSGNKIIYINL